MKISVVKITDPSIMRRACEMTFLGKSKMSVKRMAMCEHSPLRTQLYWVELHDIPLFCSTQLIRHHVGSQPYQLSCRKDRKGGNNHFQEKIDEAIDLINHGNVEMAIAILDWLRNNADRYTKVNLGICLNAQSLINIAKDRLCADASAETREIFKGIKAKIGEVEPELESFLVPKCIYRGGICNSLNPCGFNKTELFNKQLVEYKKLFTEK